MSLRVYEKQPPSYKRRLLRAKNTPALAGGARESALATTCQERVIVSGNRELIRLYEDKVTMVEEKV